ncbi:hypothetical protein EON65_13230 [archaeon]|nr:MAG: hypothetical protein EON65_13230 [archaeon]
MVRFRGVLLSVLFALIVFGHAAHNPVSPYNVHYMLTQLKAHWLFYHYHKTGHDFLIQLGSHLSYHHRISFHEPDMRRRHNMTQFFSIIKPNIVQTDMVSIVPGMFTMSWSNSLQQAFPGNIFRIVHFLRDPYEMILSGYRFHSQQVPPERWLSYPAFDFCDTRGLSERALPVLSRYKDGLEADLTSWLERMQRVCRLGRRQFGANSSFYQVMQQAVRTKPKNSSKLSNVNSVSTSNPLNALVMTKEDMKKMQDVGYLYHRYEIESYQHEYESSTNNSTTPTNSSKILCRGSTEECSVKEYDDTLSFYTHEYAIMPVDLYPAIRLEAFRALYTDILNMVASKLTADQDTDKELTWNVLLDDFDLTNDAKFRSTAEKMFQHLLRLPAVSPTECPYCAGFTVQQGVEAVYQACFARRPSPHTTSSPKFTHLTKSLMSSQESNVYKERMKADPILKDVLALMSSIVYL